MFTEALFTTADTEAPKHPSVGERTKKMWYMYTVEHYSAINKDLKMPLAVIVILAWEIPWTEEPGGPHSTGSQKSWT